MKFEFSTQQIQNLKTIILDANIKGSMAPVILGLLHILENPIKESFKDVECDNKNSQ